MEFGCRLLVIAGGLHTMEHYFTCQQNLGQHRELLGGGE